MALHNTCRMLDFYVFCALCFCFVVAVPTPQIARLAATGLGVRTGAADSVREASSNATQWMGPARKAVYRVICPPSAWMVRNNMRS